MIHHVLASIPSPGPDWQAFHIGSLTIRYYALLMILGMVFAAIWTDLRLRRRGAEPGVTIDVVFWAIPLGLIGARAYHVLTHPHDYFYAGANLWRVFFIWEGGNALFGSLIGGAIGVVIACYFTKLRFWSFADAIVPGLLLAQMVGRLGNYVNNELFGLPTTLPWGLEIRSDNPAFPIGLPDGTLFHPLFLYEIIWNGIGIALLLWLERRWRPRWGVFFGMYLVWYGLGRSWLEAIRIDPSEFGFLGIPFNVWAAFAVVVLGVVIIIVQRIRHKGLEPSVYRAGHEWHDPKAPVDFYDTAALAKSSSGS